MTFCNSDWILDKFDKDHCIKYRLYRQHVSVIGHTLVKDLSTLGRKLSRMIIIDNLAENFQRHIDNGIFVGSWVGDMNDNELKEIEKILVGTIISSNRSIKSA